MTRALVRSKIFIRASRRLELKDPDKSKALLRTLQLLTKDAFDPKLRTHKLAGDLNGCWSASAGYDMRIVFRFVEVDGKPAILLLNAGNHDEVN